jgi:predicted ABC-type ATPase
VARDLSLSDGRLIFDARAINSYVASVAADFWRRKLIARRESFTFETVMSHPDKVGLFKEARRLGYRNYLYFVATEDPAINISRVQNRVKRGGHNVPEVKIVSRYYASLDLVMEAIRSSNRAYIFDNSREGETKTWVAEITEGREMELKVEQMPAWFKPGDLGSECVERYH